MNLGKRARLTCLALALSTSIGFTACTDEEVATGIGVGAIVAGAVIIASSTHCEGGYTQYCHDYRDRRGYIHTECRSSYDSCQYIVPNHGPSAGGDEGVMPSPKDNPEAFVTDAQWGTTFGISFDSSAKVIDALSAARTGQVDPILALGFTRKDLRNIATFKMPTATGIEAVSTRLDQDPTAVREMFSKLITTAKQQKQAAAIH